MQEKSRDEYIELLKEYDILADRWILPDERFGEKTSSFLNPLQFINIMDHQIEDKVTFAPNKASMRPDAEGERPPLSDDHRTHGRIKTGKKRFYAIWLLPEIKQALLPVETL
ncbi:MAG: hypothetical protein IKH57_18485 [Clostridia bacterium]|nr:hypothetical protein [Clostridia bacterium]